MKLNEIIAHNKANLERCTTKQATFIRNRVLDLNESKNITYLFTTKGMNTRYACFVLCWDKETDRYRCIHRFGFNNRNRLRNRLQYVQKNNDDIVCRIISINSEEDF